MKQTAKMLKDNSGAALMMAMFTITVMMVIASELMYESNVELVVSSSSLNQVKAHYAAKAGVEISLLRLHMYRKVSAVAGEMVPKSMLDQLWMMPSAWPPPVPKELSSITKSEMNKSVKNSLMKSGYFSTIESEGSKIDINDLGSPSEVVAKAARQQLLQIFKSKMENDEDFARKNSGFDFERLVNNIGDWVDEDTEGKNGGQESAPYAGREQKDLPPNQAFKTIEELHLVDGMTDDLYQLIAPRITVYGTKGININYAGKDVLMSLSPTITEERANKILEGRSDPNRGPFKDEKDFVQFLQTIGVNQDPFKDEQGKPTVPLIFDSEINFRVISRGKSGRVEREIVAVVYDFDRVKERLKGLMPRTTPTPAGDQQPPGATPTPAATATPAPTQTKTVPNARPNIVYWNET